MLKSGVDGLAGVNRTDSPVRSIKSLAPREERQASHLEPLEELLKEQELHFQVEEDEREEREGEEPEEGGGIREGHTCMSSSSKTLSRLPGKASPCWGGGCWG